MIPDGVLVHNIPRSVEDASDDWYDGRVCYSFKSILLEGSSSTRGIVEVGKS